MSPSDRGDEPSTDGGQTGNDIFTRTSDIQAPGRRERFRRQLREYLLTPIAIAWNDWRTRIGTIIIVLFVLVGTVGDRYVPETAPMSGAPFTVPFTTTEHILGTDVVGRDMFRLMVHSTPPLIKMIISGALLSIVLGVLIGSIAGYKGGTVDAVLMSLTDVVLTIPGLALIMVLAALFTPRDPFVVGLLLGIDNWPGLARTIRSQVLSIREEPFVEASRTMGLRNHTIIRKDLVANLMPYISINTATSARRIIFESVALYFIGILPYSTLNWGVIMNLAYERSDLRELGEVHYILIPALAITIVSLGFVLFAQGLDRVFNVRLRAKHEGDDEDEGKGANPISDI